MDGENIDGCGGCGDGDGGEVYISVIQPSNVKVQSGPLISNTF